MNKKDLIDNSIEFLSDIINHAQRTTTGNVSHNKAQLEGTANRCAEFLTKHNIDNYELINDTIETFKHIAYCAKKLTSGNIAHSISGLIAVAKTRKSILNLPKNKLI